MLMSQSVFNEFKSKLCVCYGYQENGVSNALITTKAEADAHKKDINTYVTEEGGNTSDLPGIFKTNNAAWSDAYDEFSKSFPTFTQSFNKFYVIINGTQRLAEGKEIDYVKNHYPKLGGYIIVTADELTKIQDGVTIGKLKDTKALCKVLEARNKKN